MAVGHHSSKLVIKTIILQLTASPAGRTFYGKIHILNHAILVNGNALSLNSLLITSGGNL